MSTNGVIAFATETGRPDKWLGIYHHWDSYPTALGQTLFEAFNGHFQRNFAAMKKFLLMDHPAGWSTINGADFSLPSGYANPDNRYVRLPNGEKDYSQPIPYGPQCYCHIAPGCDRKADTSGATMTNEQDPNGFEWGYLFVETGWGTVQMHVMEVRHRDDKHSGDRTAYWKTIKVLNLEEPEPVWDRVECGDNLERCLHCAYHHFPELSGTSMECLGTAEFLGKRKVDSRHVCGYRVGDILLTPTGSGGSGTDAKGAPVWIASVRAPEGVTQADLPSHLTSFSRPWGGNYISADPHRFDIIVARTHPSGQLLNGRHVPYRGVKYVHPPTLKDPIAVFKELRLKFLTEGMEGEKLDAALKASTIFTRGRLFRDEEKGVVAA